MTRWWWPFGVYLDNDGLDKWLLTPFGHTLIGLLNGYQHLQIQEPLRGRTIVLRFPAENYWEHYDLKTGSQIQRTIDQAYRLSV